jgi:hypothetical protein
MAERHHPRKRYLAEEAEPHEREHEVVSGDDTVDWQHRREPTAL